MKNKAIQELRGIAITAVILFHAKIGLFPNGYIGVDVFFVISGYLIIPRMLHAIHYNGVWNFYKNRFLRLAPALIFMLVITLPLMLIFGSWVSHSQFLIQAGSTLFLLGNIGAFYVSGNYFAPSGFTPLVHTWSLAVEEQIYLILPLILKYKSRFLNHSIAITSLMFYIIEPILPGNLSNFNFYFFVSRIWEFYLGYIYYRQSNSNNNFLKIKTFNIYFLFLLLLFPIALPRVFATLFAFALIFLSYQILCQRKAIRIS